MAVQIPPFEGCHADDPNAQRGRSVLPGYCCAAPGAGGEEEAVDVSGDRPRPRWPSAPAGPVLELSEKVAEVFVALAPLARPSNGRDRCLRSVGRRASGSRIGGISVVSLISIDVSRGAKTMMAPTRSPGHIAKA